MEVQMLTLKTNFRIFYAFKGTITTCCKVHNCKQYTIDQRYWSEMWLEPENVSTLVM